MAAPRLAPLDFQPGTQRDGTRLDGNRYLDAKWCRWRIGRPRSMGGYSRTTDQIGGIPRKLYPFYSGSKVIMHVGTAKGIQQVVVDQTGAFVGISDRTPATFTGGINVGWTIDGIFDTTSNTVTVVAHAVPDLTSLASTQTTTPFFGQIDSTNPLMPITSASLSSGIVCVQPYLFGFSSDGLVQWSQPNQPSTLGTIGSGAGTARVSAQKIVAGAALRGGGSQSPAAIFWSLSEVINATFVGGAPIFAFNTVSPSSSILSSDAVIEYDGLYFWPGVDRFLVYNGSVVEVKNEQNQDWFFDNMNWPYAAKSFAFKVPRYGEIWFCAPLYGNTEPSHAAIFNVRDNVWYDTELPNGGRSCGYYAQGFRNPFMGGIQANANGYRLWEHEIGTDEVDGDQTNAVQKYFETGYMSGLKNAQPDGRALRVAQLEPDLILTGNMSVSVQGQINARAPEQPGDAVPIPFSPTNSAEWLPAFKEQRRLLRLRFESNEVGGSFIMGKSMAHLEPTDPRNLP